MTRRAASTTCSDVPRKGNVDRNQIVAEHAETVLATFPARGTWIEIRQRRSAHGVHCDVPRKGNVDRNIRVAGAVVPNAEDVPRKGNVDRN